jgi:hypothetical protein
MVVVAIVVCGLAAGMVIGGEVQCSAVLLCYDLVRIGALRLLCYVEGEVTVLLLHALAWFLCL